MSIMHLSPSDIAWIVARVSGALQASQGARLSPSELELVCERRYTQHDIARALEEQENLAAKICLAS